MSNITGILLAAGSSRRFGKDKLTQTLPNGDLVAARACRNLAAGVDKVLAVVRPENEALMACLQAEGAEVHIFADARQGMGSSLAFAIQASPASGGWLIALADMPWVMPATICQVADCLRGGAAIVVPCYQGRRGHPVGFSERFADQLAALSGDSGAKALIQTHPELLHIIDGDDAGVLRDIDQPADLLNLTF
ncbi:MAG: nucleotidyltransferase family protein [Methylomonas sp.]|jgi:molybdenum cofactor cytidylyltransferase|uniref:nucleotidyltransferase family protein n=1 Tax=Methylomonas sp. TaxID=418 RepID=UPI0025CDBBF9|nr:nucleotidyltransferase family protein [Methylomonas sp.]MCK9604911.1 nucleotidyltransferase family protein [Methylomonas sp.]